ncbi:hypothetical protein LguiA_011033 [Lonicera macranthoides]
MAYSGRRPAVNAVASIVRLTWPRPLVTTIFVYIFILLYTQVSRTLVGHVSDPSLRIGVLVIGLCVEVQLMTVTSMGLVVSMNEDRFGLDAIRIGSDLMKGSRVCGWVLSGLFIIVSGAIGWKVEQSMDGGRSMDFISSIYIFLLYCTFNNQESAISVRKVNWYVLSVCAAETLVIVKGLKFASAKGVTISMCCSDCYFVVRQVKFGTQLLSNEVLLIEDINLELALRGFSNVSFSSRSANRVVHMLARKALEIDGSCEWGFSLLSWIIYDVVVDLV